jgi:hypothetical protein
MVGLGDDMSETPILNVSDMGGKVSTAGIFPWPVPRDEGPRDRNFILRDWLREDS